MNVASRVLVLMVILVATGLGVRVRHAIRAVAERPGPGARRAAS